MMYDCYYTSTIIICLLFVLGEISMFKGCISIISSRILMFNFRISHPYEPCLTEEWDANLIGLFNVTSRRHVIFVYAAILGVSPRYRQCF